MRGDKKLEIIVRHPDTIEKQRQLCVKVSVVHAHAIVSCLQKLNCPEENKINILKDIKKSLAGESLLTPEQKNLHR